LSYTYNESGSLLTTRSSNANGVSVDYSYDALNRLATVKDNNLAALNGGITTYNYDTVGNLQSYLYPNGVTTNYNYNTLNRLTSMNVTTPVSTLASYNYTLGASGNRTAVTELSGRTVNYTYDDLYRLTGEAIANDPHGVSGSANYNYDPVGNRLDRTSSVAGVPSHSSTYDANDRLTSDTYDPNGNTTVSNGNTYNYDFENRLVSLSTQNSGLSTFLYDGDGNRVAKTVAGVTTNYLVDANNLTGYAQVVEELQSGAVVKSFTYGHDLISQRIVGGTLNFYGYDGHGSVRLLIDATAAVTDTYDYDAFGNLIYHSGTTPNDYLYSGEQFDANLGFYYLRARYMNPASGRFSTMDSFEGRFQDQRSLHRYVYVNDNPVSLIDPGGHFGSADSLITLDLSLTIASLSTVGLGLLSYVRGGWRNGQTQIPTQAELGSAIVNYTAVEVVGSRVTADEFFDQFVRTFQGVNEGDVASVSGGPVNGVGQTITFSLKGAISSLGQQPFDVRVQRFDPNERTMSAVTLGGHPLRGWRYWRVVPLGDPNHFAVETGAVDVANRDIDLILGKSALRNVLPIWEQYMQHAVEASGGQPRDYLIPGSRQGVSGSPGGQAFILDAVHP
jgi:RHS repeat-associated protein